MRRILLVDQDVDMLHALHRALREHGHVAELHVEMFTNPFDALTRCDEVCFDIVVSDFGMAEMSGVEFLHALKGATPTTVRMMLSASTEFDAIHSAINEAEVFRYIAKPWRIGEVSESIRLALLHRDAMLEEQHLADRQRLCMGALTPEQEELKRLQQEEPGLLKVKWGPNGEIIL